MDYAITDAVFHVATEALDLPYGERAGSSK